MLETWNGDERARDHGGGSEDLERSGVPGQHQPDVVENVAGDVEQSGGKQDKHVDRELFFFFFSFVGFGGTLLEKEDDQTERLADCHDESHDVGMLVVSGDPVDSRGLPGQLKCGKDCLRGSKNHHNHEEDHDKYFHVLPCDESAEAADVKIKIILFFHEPKD